MIISASANKTSIKMKPQLPELSESHGSFELHRSGLVADTETHDTNQRFPCE